MAVLGKRDTVARGGRAYSRSALAATVSLMRRYTVYKQRASCTCAGHFGRRRCERVMRQALASGTSCYGQASTCESGYRKSL